MALDALENRKKEDRSIEKLQQQVRQRLKLRRFLRDTALDVQKFRGCCSRLLADAATLAILTESMSLRVSEKNGIAEDGSIIDIAWDFRI